MRTGNDCGFGNRRVLDQHAFQFEWAEPIIGRLEDVVGPADKGEIAIRVSMSDVPRVVKPITNRREALFVISGIAWSEANRPMVQIQADFPIVSRTAVQVQ